MGSYDSLSRARLTYEYLHTNSTTHEFLFGALAELVDNSRDAGATKTHIFTVPSDSTRGNFIMCFLDNGCGMDQTEVSQVIQFGRSSKRLEANSNLIGQYGNGLKSGSMRIGKDMLLFTKKNDTVSCLFLSRTFHEREKLQEVVVPMPSWSLSSGMPIATTEVDRIKHKTEVDIITRFSPFKNEQELKSQFKQIKLNGTLVMIYNLKLMDNGEPELLISPEEHDIKMADPHADEIYDTKDKVYPERVSFRSYVSVLYSEPRMKIYIEGKKVRTRRLISCLCRPRSYCYSSTRFKRRSEQEVEKAEREASLAEERAKELLTQYKELQQSTGHLNKAAMSKIQIAERDYNDAKQHAEYKQIQSDGKRRSLKEPKTLTFTFGFNLDKRSCDGMFIYNCNRLIRMYESIGPQTEGGVKCAGIIGVVDVPYLVLEPTHNKQDFADSKEYKHLLKSMADHMVQYWKDSKIESMGSTSFWTSYGYVKDWDDDPSQDTKAVLKRLMDVPKQIQCDSCLKWRELKFSRKLAEMEIPDEWTCADNSDPKFQSCNKAEQKANIPIGKLQRPVKNLDEKKAEEIRRLKERLEKAEEKVAFAPPPRVPQSTSSVPPLSAVTTPDKHNRANEEAASPSPQMTSRLKQQQQQRLNQQKMQQEQQRQEQDQREIRKRRKQQEEEDRSEKAKKSREDAHRKAQQKEERVAVSRSPKPKLKPKKRRRLNSDESDDEEMPLSAVSKQYHESNVSSTTTGSSPLSFVLPEEETSAIASPTSPLTSSTVAYDVQDEVEVCVNDRWYGGKVVAIKHLGSSRGVQVRVQSSKSGPDRWFAQSDSNLRPCKNQLSKSQPPVSNSSSKDSKVSTKKSSASDDVPSTMVVAADSSVKDDTLDAVCDLFRQCLCYFRAPDFHMDQDVVLSLTASQLKSFPLTKFTEDYERKIRQLVGSQDTLRDQLKETEEAKRKLNSANAEHQKSIDAVEEELKSTKESLLAMRRDVNFLIRNLLTDKDNLEESDRSSHVDNLLEAIVSQIQSEL